MGEPEHDTVMGEPEHDTCIETTSYADLNAGRRSYVCGPECPRGPVVRPAPDPERDERVRLRRAADARRAGHALDVLLAVCVERDHDQGPPARCRRCRAYDVRKRLSDEE